MEEDIKILEEFKKNGYSMLIMKYGDRYKAYVRLERALENLLTGYKQLEEENKKMAEEYLVNNPGMVKYLNDNYIFKSKVKEILNKEKLPLTIVGGRRNAKTLEYGRKLGRIEVCKELLGKE